MFRNLISSIIFSHDYNRKRRCEWKLHTVQKMEVFIDSYYTHYVKNALICFLLFFLNLVLCSCSRTAFVDLPAIEKILQTEKYRYLNTF